VDELDEDYYPPRRNGAGRVVVVLVVLGALTLTAWAGEKRYHLVEWAEAVARGGSTTAPVDPRSGTLLAEGERALLAGDVDAAQTAFDKASVLTGTDPQILLDLSRVAAAKADVSWLKLRLLAPDATDAIRVAKADLGEHAAVAVRTAQDAATAKPDDPRALTAKVDALRLAGETDAARMLVVAVFGRASEPETAYVLAALDMTQPAPAWPSIADRLRVAAAGEWSSGRAHAALVYALAKAGDIAGAKAEMSKLDALARPYPCLPDLRALLMAGQAAPAPAADARDAGASADTGPDAARPAKGSVTQGAAQGASDEPGDTTPAGPLLAANQAMGVHDYSRAEQIYQAILTSQPGDSQALSGLGDIARARNDHQGAISAYRRAVAVNPSYLPALLGLADTQWFGGERAAAVSGYKNIEDHFPEGTYPDYVRSRASGTQ
jgi:tetratricopeptide (TPR) repeat protein